MKSKQTAATRSRDIGLNHGAGKGDADRTSNLKLFKANFDEIIWYASGYHRFTRRGNKFIKKY